MAQTLFFVIIGIIIFEFLFSNYLSYLNAKSWKSEVPDEFKDLYDAEKYQKAQDYAKARKQLSNVSGILQFAGILAFLFLGGFAWLDNWVRSITTNPVGMALLFFGVLGVINELVSMPFRIYSTFVIEEKFGFNKTTPTIFIIDLFKGYILGGLIAGGLLAVLVWIYHLNPNRFWILAWAIVTAFSLFMVTFYTSLLLPIFNKLSPLKDGELKNAITEYAKKVDFPLSKISVIDGSKRSTKANAFFSGMGKNKSIVLYDTLIKEHSTDELVAVLAHEVGHYKRKHIIKNQIIGVLSTGIIMFLLGWALGNPVLAQALGVEQPSFHIGILAFSLLYSPISLITGILMNRLSRKYEFEADAYARDTSDATALGNCLKKMSVNHLSNLQPHPAYVSVYYSHPPLLERLRAMQQ